MNKLLLKSKGWNVENLIPLEIRHEYDGSYATGQAAQIVYDLYEKEQEYALELLERTITKKHRTKFIIEDEYEEGIITAVRTLDGTYNTRTHNLKFNKITGYLWWENNNSQDWNYQFQTVESAIIWWNTIVMTHVVENKIKNNESANNTSVA